MSGRATYRRSGDAVMACDVADDAARDGTFHTTFGVSRERQRAGGCNDETPECSAFHDCFPTEFMMMPTQIACPSVHGRRCMPIGAYAPGDRATSPYHRRYARRSHAMRSLAVAFAAAALFLGAPAVHAAEITVLAANAVKDAYIDVVAAFEAATGHKVTTRWGGSVGLAKRAASGEVFDVLIISAPDIDRLISEGKLARGSRADLATSAIGVAVRSGAPKPDISSANAVRQAVLDARSVAYSSGPSGFYLVELFQRMGIAEQIKGKVIQPPSGSQMAELLARGEADLAFQQVSELIHAKGIVYLGLLPPEIQHTTLWSASLHAAAPAADAAKAFIDFFESAQARAMIVRSGLGVAP